MCLDLSLPGRQQSAGTVGRLTEEAAVDVQDRRAVVAIAPTAVGDNLDR